MRGIIAPIDPTQVIVRIEDTPTIWRSLPDGNRYAQIPPIYNQDTGVEIQRQMDEEGLTAQSVVRRAIAFSKVPLTRSKGNSKCWKSVTGLGKENRI